MKWLGRVLLVVVLLLVGSYLFLQTPDTDPAGLAAVQRWIGGMKK